MVLVRFAPSPTGSLHLGGLRTALLNHLFARKSGGKWILRVEDTDQTRLVPGSVENIKSSLEWARLDYDYGPGRPGPHGPYVQSQRLDLYHDYARKLLESGHAYRCFCSQNRLFETREALARAGSYATYDRKCFHQSEEETARRVRAGEKFAIRLKDHTNPPLEGPFTDLVFGQHRQATSSQSTDAILVKGDQFPTYHFASVVDDHSMGITHVIRGEEWLSSLPLHLRLYNALSLIPPKFAHVPLLLNPDGTKMSKRKGDVQVSDYIVSPTGPDSDSPGYPLTSSSQWKGWEPQAVINWLALAGWRRPHDLFSHEEHPVPHTDVMSLDELIQKFELSDITHRRNILDPQKLTFLNRQHLQRQLHTPADLPTLIQRSSSILKKAIPDSDFLHEEYVKRALPSLLERVDRLDDIPHVAPYLFRHPDYSTSLARTLRSKIPDESYYIAIKTSLELLKAADFTEDSIKTSLQLAKDSNGLSQRDFMNSLRYALTASNLGPSVAGVIEILGRDRVLERLASSF